MARTHDDYTRNTLVLRVRDMLREVLDHGCPEDAESCAYCDERVKWMGVRMGAVVKILEACQAELAEEREFSKALAADAERLIAEAQAALPVPRPLFAGPSMRTRGALQVVQAESASRAR